MLSMLRVGVVALAAVGITACAALQEPYQQATAMSPSGGNFDQAMYRDYIALSDVEYQQGDYRDGEAYAARAMIEGRGETLLPEEISARPYLDPGYKPELAAARERLISVLNRSARQKVPDLTATAQAMFDCWMEQAEENMQPDQIAACREGFMNAIAQIEAALGQPSAYLVFFDFDKSYLTPEAGQIVQAVANEAQQRGFSRIVATGHTDTVGSNAYNQALSMRRAESVKDALVSMGIPASKVVTRGEGETMPLIPTGDGVREPQNRRVEMDIQGEGMAGS